MQEIERYEGWMMGGMLVRVELELEDVPGQLIKVLEPIAKFGGNIQNVVHRRERKTPLGRVPVTVIFDAGEQERLDRIISAIRERGVSIVHVGEREGALKRTVLLIGHVVDTDIRDTLDRLYALGGVMVSDLSLAMAGADKESAARMTITTDTEERMSSALSELRKVAEVKKLLVVEPLEGG